MLENQYLKWPRNDVIKSLMRKWYIQSTKNISVFSNKGSEIANIASNEYYKYLNKKFSFQPLLTFKQNIHKPLKRFMFSIYVRQAFFPVEWNPYDA